MPGRPRTLHGSSRYSTRAAPPSQVGRALSITLFYLSIRRRPTNSCHCYLLGAIERAACRRCYGRSARRGAARPGQNKRRASFSPPRLLRYPYKIVQPCRCDKIHIHLCARRRRRLRPRRRRHCNLSISRSRRASSPSNAPDESDLQRSPHVPSH